jgi:hypothetical protein
MRRKPLESLGAGFQWYKMPYCLGFQAALVLPISLCRFSCCAESRPVAV